MGSNNWDQDCIQNIKNKIFNSCILPINIANISVYPTHLQGSTIDVLNEKNGNDDGLKDQNIGKDF